MAPQITPETLGDLAKEYLCLAWPVMMGVATRSNPAAFALGVPAAALMSRLVCPPNNYPNPTPVYQLPVPGSQCPGAVFELKYNFRLVDGGGMSGTNYVEMYAPVGGWGFEKGLDGFGRPTWLLKYQDAAYPSGRTIVVGLNSDVWEVNEQDYYKKSGPDNCGNPDPVWRPPIPDPNPYPEPPPCPDGFICLPDFEKPVPFPDPPSTRPIILPIVVAPIPIPFPVPVPLPFPIVIPIIVGGGANGGALIGAIILEFNGSWQVVTNPDAQFQLQRLLDLLNKIKECACAEEGGGGTQVETVQLPVLAEGGCEADSVSLSVEKGAYSSDISSRVQRTLTAAIDGCRAKNPEQKPQALLGTGTAPFPYTEQFIEVSDRDVYSVLIEMDGWTESAQSIGKFGTAGQRKFGSVAVSNATGRSGDAVYIYDSQTYLVLPKSPGKRYLRFLLAPGTEFSVYDTGERVSR